MVLINSEREHDRIIHANNFLRVFFFFFLEFRAFPNRKTVNIDNYYVKYRLMMQTFQDYDIHES